MQGLIKGRLLALSAAGEGLADREIKIHLDIEH
jgi:hypothetical protein